MRSSERLLVALAIAAVGVTPTAAHAQDLEGCDQIERLAAAGEYAEALVELGWCQRSLSELHYQRILDVLGVEIEGYAPGEGTAEAALGFSTIEITHSMGGDRIETTLASGTGGAESPMAGLGALASLGSAFGVQQRGVEQVRLGRNTGRLEEKSGGQYSLMVTLSGGQILTHEGSDSEVLQAFAMRAIELLEGYLGR